MEAPKLKKEQVSVLACEYETGIVLNKDFIYNNNSEENNDVYWVFENKKIALKFILKNILSNSSLEFIIYNFEGEYLSTHTQDSK